MSMIREGVDAAQVVKISVSKLYHNLLVTDGVKNSTLSQLGQT